MARSQAARSDTSNVGLSPNGYPGSKSASGVAERIIREMPPHKIFVEGFAGRAAIWRKKRPAATTLLIDADAKACHWLRSYIAGRDVGQVEVLHGDAMQILPSHSAVRAPDTLAYLDPPYLGTVRTKKALYDFEFTSHQVHSSFLTIAAALPCMVMISGYMSPLYARRLKRWRLVEIPAMTHGGLRTECLWCNFPPPDVLHDPRFVGGDYRERDRIKRKQRRWMIKFAKMDTRERQAIAAALIGVDRPSVEAALWASQKGKLHVS